MKKPVVDYRELRLSNIREPRFSHLFLLLGWVGYFLAYMLTENLIPAEQCYTVHSRLDDWIPFCEWFVIPYVGWYVLVAGSLLYFLLYNVDGFRRLQIFIMITQVVAMIIYILFPNRQDMRPEVFANENVLTWLVGIIYKVDTPTNVCPSLHVAYSIGIASVWVREKQVSKGWRGLVVFFAILISLSTLFMKQHSAVDVLAAIPVCILAEWLVYHKWNKKIGGMGRA